MSDQWSAKATEAREIPGTTIFDGNEALTRHSIHDLVRAAGALGPELILC